MFEGEKCVCLHGVGIWVLVVEVMGSVLVYCLNSERLPGK